MPYKIRKVRGKELFYVYNPVSKVKFSYEPLDKETAMKQLRALYAKDGEEFKEKKVMMTKMRYPKGSQEAKDAMAKAREAKKPNPT